MFFVKSLFFNIDNMYMYKMNFWYIKIYFVIELILGVICLDVSNGKMISILLVLYYDVYVLLIKWYM